RPELIIVQNPVPMPDPSTLASRQAVEVPATPAAKKTADNALVCRRIGQEARKRIAELHERYLKGVPNGWCVVMKECDLSGLDFRNLHFAHGHFIGCDFSGANLEDARYMGANLFGSKFDHSNMTRTNHSRADLRGANFAGAEMTEAQLDAADMGRG